MKNVLIVDDEKSFLLSLAAGLREYASHFNVLIAGNGERAVKILESITVDLVVTDIRMPGMDGFELLAHINKNFPSIPSIVMSAYGTPQMEGKLQSLGTLKLLNKPLDFAEMADAIIKGLESDNTVGSLKGISLDSFLQLIEMEQKTCLLEVLCSSKKKGFFYFNKGKLYDAFCGDLKGEMAAIEMISWNRVNISFKNLPDEKISRQIEKGLMSLIMEGTRQKDESTETDMEDVSGVYDLADISEVDFVLEENEAEDEQKALESILNFATDPEMEIKPELIDEVDLEEEPRAVDEVGQKGDLDEKMELEEGKIKQGEIAQQGTKIKEKNITKGLKDILREMSNEMDAVVALGIFGMDGITVSVHNPAGIDMDVYGAKFAVLMKLSKNAVNDLKSIGDFEDNVLQAKEVWVLTTFVSRQYYLIIVIGREGTLGNVRLVVKKYMAQLRSYV